MTHRVSSGDTVQSVSQLGFWSSLLLAVSTAAALGIAVTTAPARSGPNCPPLVEMGVVEACIAYPYTDVAAFVPKEYLWMYPALLTALLFVVVVVCVHAVTPVDKKLLSHIAAAFAVLAGAVHASNYIIQLAVFQPSVLRGEVEGLALWSQYNPHGIFIALENVGYLLMGVAFICMAGALNGRGRLERTLRVLFFVAGVVATLSLVALALWYGYDLEYRYEVLAIVVDWLTLIVSGVLLSFLFRRIQKGGARQKAA